MEISGNVVCFTVLLIIGLVYLLYSTLCNNYVLSHELEKKGGYSSDESSDDESDNESNNKTKKKSKKESCNKKNKSNNKISSLISKGVKAYSSSNELEEIPKFL